MGFEIRQGDVLKRLAEMPEASVHCCVTSPPYWRLRDYDTAVWEGGSADCDHIYNHGVQGSQGERASRTFTAQAVYRDVCRKCSAVRVDSQIGLEKTPEEYIAKMIHVFAGVRRVLREDGTLWINIGDSYNNREGQRVQNGGIRNDVAGWKQSTNTGSTNVGSRHDPKLKPKDLVGIPWMLAFALRADGWYLRSEIIWHKPNPMPESVKDRPTKAHEQIFLLSKSEKYYYDWEAIQEKASEDTHARYAIAKSLEHMRDRTPAGWHQGSRPATPQGILDKENAVDAKIPKQDQVGNRRYTGFNARWDAKESARRDGVNPKCAEPGSGIKMNSSFSGRREGCRRESE